MKRGLMRTILNLNSANITRKTLRVPSTACMTIPSYAFSNVLEMPPRNTPWIAA